MTRGVRTGGGWVLLEMMVALAIFVLTALAVLGAVDRGLTSAGRTRDYAKAVDLATSTMAKLGAGLGTVQSLSGPVPPWEPPLVSDGPFDESAPGGFSETAPVDTGWEVEVDTVRSEFAGLTHVIVTVVKRPNPDSESLDVSYTLHQLVRLGDEGEDVVGELDDMAVEALRGGGN